MKKYILTLLLLLLSYMCVSQNNDTIIKFKYYTVNFNKHYKQANYASYKLTKDMLVSKYKRKDYFYNDIKNLSTLNNMIFKGSGFDRGHLVPAANMSFDSIALRESFEYVNITFQYPSFNRGIWKTLESKINKFSEYYDTLYIITGPLFKNTENLIPDAFFKVILIKNQETCNAVGFYIPNMKDKKEYTELSIYARSIDEIEQITHYNFFNWLDKDIEKSIESDVDYSFWFYK